MFPITITLHDAAQLSAVLTALHSTVTLKASDFACPAVGAAYEEVSARIEARNEAHNAAHAATEDAAAPAGKPQAQQAAAPTPQATAPAPGEPTSPPAPTPPTAAAVAGAAPAKTGSASAPSAASAAAEPPPSTAATEPAAVNYDQVKKAINTLAKTHREHVVDTLGAFGVRVGKDLKPEHYAAFLAALEQLPAQLPEEVPA